MINLRAQASSGKGDFESALDDIKNAFTLEPNNTEIRKVRQNMEIPKQIVKLCQEYKVIKEKYAQHQNVWEL